MQPAAETAAARARQVPAANISTKHRDISVLPCLFLSHLGAGFAAGASSFLSSDPSSSSVGSFTFSFSSSLSSFNPSSESFSSALSSLVYSTSSHSASFSSSSFYPHSPSGASSSLSVLMTEENQDERTATSDDFNPPAPPIPEASMNDLPLVLQPAASSASFQFSTRSSNNHHHRGCCSCPSSSSTFYSSITHSVSTLGSRACFAISIVGGC